MFDVERWMFSAAGIRDTAFLNFRFCQELSFRRSTLNAEGQSV
jgi:hypothetical protein